MARPLSEIAKALKGRIVGDAGLQIEGISALETAKAGELSFVADKKNEKKAAVSGASALIVRAALEGLEKTFLVVDNPYFAFAQAMVLFYPPKTYPSGVDSSAVLGTGVDIGKRASVGQLAIIENNVKIGERARIGAGVFVGEGSIIGDDTLIHPNVTIREGVKIGARVIVHSGTVIGSDGFGFAPDQGRYHKIPQVGGVIIEDDVELGSNVSVDRGALGDTVIGRGTKVDNLVQIGHNVVIGNDTILVAQVGISGSVKIGHHATLAGQVGVAGHLTIGDHVVLGGKSGVTKDIPSGSGMTGFPPIPHKDWLRAQAVFRHLPEMKNQVKNLNEKIAQLENEMSKLKNRENA